MSLEGIELPEQTAEGEDLVSIINTPSRTIEEARSLFEEEEDPEAEEETPSADLGEDPKELEPEPEKPPTATKLKSSAKWILSAFNAGQSMVFRLLYTRKLIRKEDREALTDFRAEKEANPMLDTSPETIREQHPKVAVAMDRESTLEELVQGLPFNEEELKMIQEPLEELIAQNPKMMLSPEWSLVIAVVMVFLPRVTQLLAKP